MQNVLDLKWYALLAAPAAAIAILATVATFDLSLSAPIEHLYLVIIVSLLEVVLAGALILGARMQPSARTLFLGLAFLSLAGFHLAHALGQWPLFGNPQSPEEYAQMLARLRLAEYPEQLSFSTGAVFFWLSTVDHGNRVDGWTRRWGTALTLGLVVWLFGHMYVAAAYPALVEWAPLGAPIMSWPLAATAIGMFTFAGWRFYQSYTYGKLPLQGALAVSMVLLAQAQGGYLLADDWHLSWWLYHLALLAGLSVGIFGLLNHYRLTRDLGTIVEGLFLRRKIHAVRAGDPRGLAALDAAVTVSDFETADHVLRVSGLSVAMGELLSVPEDRLKVLRWAGQLHDVGKIAVPSSILNKAGPLSHREFETVKLHTLRGWEIAIRSGELASAARAIRAHHERMDGMGYPDSLRGAEISFEARIVAVADVWDALTSDRPYRSKMSWREAVEVMIKETGGHLDPEVVEALFEVIGVQVSAGPVTIRPDALVA